MFTVLESVIVLSYLLDSRIGFILMLCFTFYTLFFNKKDNLLIRLFRLSIMSLPMSFISILGESFHHMFSWYNIFLCLFIILFITKKYTITKLSLLSIIVLFYLFIIEIFLSHNKFESIVEVLQIFAMIIPIVLVSNIKEKLPIESFEVKKLIFNYSDVCVATAIGMLIQYVLYKYGHIIVGFVRFFGGNRVDFYGLFRGASILPIFMGIGFIILLMDLLDNKIKIKNIVKMFIIFLAMILNSSRSGLFSLVIISTIIFINHFFKKFGYKTILLGFVFFIVMISGVNYLTNVRANLNGFLDDNGRFEGWKNALFIWTSSVKSFLFGEGFSGGLWQFYPEPHNMIIQTLSQCGIFVTIIILLMLIMYLYKNKKNLYKYLIWFVLLSGMLVTDFYANSFTTVILILVNIYGVKNISNKKEVKLND